MTRPACLDEPYSVTSNCKPVHQYWVPSDGKDLLEALKWLLENYEEVEHEYGQSYGSAYSYLTCYKPIARHGQHEAH